MIEYPTEVCTDHSRKSPHQNPGSLTLEPELFSLRETKKQDVIFKRHALLAAVRENEKKFLKIQTARRLMIAN